MNQNNLKSMSTDELWALHEEVTAKLAVTLIAEKRVLERTKSGRRPYPTVVPKFQNPDRPSETWAGRGKTPRWLTAKLKSGKRIDDFRIRKVA